MIFSMLLNCLSTQAISSQDSVLYFSNDKFQLDTLKGDDLPILTQSFYNNKNVLERNYDYELLNRKRKLNVLSKDMFVLGSVTTMAFSIGCGILFHDINCPMWISLPSFIVLGGGCAVAFVLYGLNLKKKSNAIHIASFPIYKVGHTGHLYVSHFNTDKTKNGIGLSYKYNF